MTTRRWLSWVGIAALVAVALVVGTRPDGGPAGPGDRATAIAEALRCPVCQGLSVADSDSETARSIRDDIERRIAEGQSDTEIRQAYVDRYGEWILLRPRGRGLGVLVWLLPAAAIAAAAAGLAVAGHHWRRRWRRQATDVDRELVAQALAARRSGHEALAGPAGPPENRASLPADVTGGDR